MAGACICPGVDICQPPSSGGGGGAVNSVFGRTGNVVALFGDYNTDQVANTSDVSGVTLSDALENLQNGSNLPGVIFVDSEYAGSVENGSSGQPFKDLPQAAAALGILGTQLRVAPGSYTAPSVVVDAAGNGSRFAITSWDRGGTFSDGWMTEIVGTITVDGTAFAGATNFWLQGVRVTEGVVLTGSVRCYASTARVERTVAGPGVLINSGALFFGQNDTTLVVPSGGVCLRAVAGSLGFGLDRCFLSVTAGGNVIDDQGAFLASASYCQLDGLMVGGSVAVLTAEYCEHRLDATQTIPVGQSHRYAFPRVTSGGDPIWNVEGTLFYGNAYQQVGATNIATGPGTIMDEGVQGGGGGAVTSVFGRVGVVVAATNDYNSDQVANNSSVAGASVSDALDNLNVAGAPGCDFVARTKAELVAAAAGVIGDEILLQANSVYCIAGDIDLTDVVPGTTFNSYVRLQDGTVLTGGGPFSTSGLSSNNNTFGTVTSPSAGFSNGWQIERLRLNQASAGANVLVVNNTAAYSINDVQFQNGPANHIRLQDASVAGYIARNFFAGLPTAHIFANTNTRQTLIVQDNAFGGGQAAIRLDATSFDNLAIRSNYFQNHGTAALDVVTGGVDVLDFSNNTINVGRGVNIPVAAAISGFKCQSNTFRSVGANNMQLSAGVRGALISDNMFFGISRFNCISGVTIGAPGAAPSPQPYHVLRNNLCDESGVGTSWFILNESAIQTNAPPP